MSKLYKLELFFKNGRKVIIPPLHSKALIIEKMNAMLEHKIRYFKHNGIDYGEYGKFITFEEENGGLNLVNIYVYEEIDIITLTE